MQFLKSLFLRKFLELKLKSKFKDFFRTVFPSSLSEAVVFLSFFVAYGSLASYIALNFRIIFDNRIPWDGYFSFDNRSIVLTGGGFERHPLSNYFFKWLRDFAFLFSDGKMNGNFRLVLALSSSFTISMANVQIFKYLKNIIRLPLSIGILIIAFFGLFVTPVLLSFTPETYTYTLFFLVLFNYYTGLKLRKNEKLSGIAMTFAGISIGGLTITNIVKIYIPLIFEKGIFKSWKIFGNAVLRVMISAGVFILLFLNRLNFEYEKIFSKAEQQYDKFSEAKSVPVWDMIWSYFFGGNMLFSGYEVRDYHNLQKTFNFKAIFMEPYSSFWNYFFVALIFGLVFWSYLKNFKNKLVQILIISFSVDILIHCVMKFGLHTSYIYGGHFIFVVPLMLGWLFYSYKNNPKILSFFYSALLISFIYFGINNFLRMEEFFDFLNLYYR